MFDAITSQDAAKIGKMTDQIFKDALGAEISCQSSFIIISSIKADLLLNIHKLIPEEQKSAEKKREEKERTEDLANITLVMSKPVLSPVKGIKLSSLRKGDTVQVLLDKDNPISHNFLKSLNLIENNTVKPLGAVIHSIKKGKDGHFNLYVEITKGMYAKAEEERDIKIKTGNPEITKEKGKFKYGLTIGIVAGLIAAAIIILKLYLKIF